MSEVRLIDTTLRDGQQSLWAMNMRTSVMLTVLERMDRAGFEAMEFFVPVVQMKKMVRDLHEDPWQWLKLGTELARHTSLRLHAGYRSGLGKVPESISKLMVKKIAEHGIEVARISDPWNDFDVLKEEHDEMRKMGIESVVNIIYSVSPRHTDEYFVERAKKAAALKPYRLCFKDVGGLATPERMRELVPKIQQVAGDIVIEFHGHCNNSLGPLNAMEAVKLGIRYVHTAVPPLANGSSQPSVFNVASNIRALGHGCAVDEASLTEVTDYLTAVAHREGLAIGAPVEYDEKLYEHQIPGGMISNLRYQLQKVGMEHRLAETIEEVARVRAEFGYPIMVTPLSQFVGTQAAINVITGGRYEQVTDEVIQLALGRWGQEAVEVMNPDVRDRILGRARAKEIEAQTMPELSVAEVRKKFGGNLSDEELILRAYIDGDAVNLCRHLPTPRAESLSGERSLVQTVRQMASLKNRSRVHVSNGDFSVTLAKR